MTIKNNESRVSLDVANHILPTASNLLGVCFLLLSFIKVNHIAATTSLDEFLTGPIVFFFLASILSYLSLRTQKHRLRYEVIADQCFILGLLSLTFIAIVFIFEVWT